MSDTKLTKKQLKALKHRQGRSQRKAAKNELLQELAEPDVRDEDEQPIESNAAPAKKRKRDSAEGVTDATEDAVEGEAQPKGKKRRKSNKVEAPKRYKCFVGNLPYNITEEQIKSHFVHEEQHPVVRLQTSKASEAEPGGKSKGFAFVEFDTAPGLQNALRLHHSELGKRKINVELSAGGGGSGDRRKQKIEIQRNKLNTQRARRAKALTEKKTAVAQEKEARKKAAPPTSAGNKPKRTAAEKRAARPMKKPQLSGGNAY